MQTLLNVTNRFAQVILVARPRPSVFCQATVARQICFFSTGDQGEFSFLTLRFPFCFDRKDRFSYSPRPSFLPGEQT
jgi:hypothetical protein